MTEPKFKPGQRAWHVTQGVVTLKESAHPRKPVSDAFGNLYSDDGKHYSEDKFPTLLTLEEARARGFPVPKEPLRVELRVRWEEQDGWVVPCYEGDNPAFEDKFIPLLGRIGTLVFCEEDEQ